MKKTIIFVLIILSALIVYAATFDFTPVTFNPKVEPELIVNDFVFDCDGKEITTQGTEPNDEWDEGDIEKITRDSCSGTITNIKKNGVLYQEKYGLKSFDVEELKIHKCRYEGKEYNSTKDDCIEIINNTG